MSRSLPSARTVALLLLLVAGGALSFSFHATVDGANVTYTATPVEPGADPERVTRAASNVTDLDERLSDTSAHHQRPIRTAAATGSYTGRLSPELDIVIDDLESPYVRYNGSYYAWSLSPSDGTTNATIRMRPTEPDTVFANVSRPAAGAPPEIRTAIDRGTATGLTVAPGLYHEGGTYYAVAPENEAAVVTRLASVLVGAVLTPVGRGYAAVALGILGYRYRDPTRDRPLTVRRAAAVAALAVPIAFVGTVLFESGSATRFVTSPTSAFVAAAGVVAGVLAARRRWLSLAGVTVGTGLLATAAVTAALGVVGLFFGPAIAFVGVVTGVVPFGYGYWFAQRAPDPSPDGDR